MYWTDSGAPRIKKPLRRADLNGQNVEVLSVPSGFFLLYGIALDLAGGKVYWGEWDRSLTANASKIWRADLNGANKEEFVTTGLVVIQHMAISNPAVVEQVANNLQDIVDGDPLTPLADKLTDAIDKLDDAIFELGKTPPGTDRTSTFWPFNTRRSSTRFTPRGLFGKSGWMTDHSKSLRS